MNRPTQAILIPRKPPAVTQGFRGKRRPALHGDAIKFDLILPEVTIR